jgi:hypothetical protein
MTSHNQVFTIDPDRVAKKLRFVEELAIDDGFDETAK